MPVVHIGAPGHQNVHITKDGKKKQKTKQPHYLRIYCEVEGKMGVFSLPSLMAVNCSLELLLRTNTACRLPTYHDG